MAHVYAHADDRDPVDVVEWWAAQARERPCLVCELPCATEGQLCRECAVKGHRVTDHEVIFNLVIDLPEVFRE